jgi:hypothetical protein
VAIAVAQPFSRQGKNADGGNFQGRLSKQYLGQSRNRFQPWIGAAASRDQFANLLIELGTRSLLEAGCGDFNWTKEVQLPIARYFGVDVVSELIAKNHTNYKADSSFSWGDCARRHTGGIYSDKRLPLWRLEPIEI